jgi:formylglycine-generating enzyme required for sulfatase activity
MDREQDVQAALFDFVAQWNDDRAQGKFLPLSDYLARFPEHEAEIAREYLRIEHAGDSGSRAEANHLPLDASPAHALASRYRSIREIARGGMGRILRVRDQNLDRDVAMKVSLEHRAGGRARLVEEAHITGELDHPGVVPVHDLGEDEDGRTFFTMRLVDGRDLREIIGMVHRREDGWNLTRALEVLLKVCDTLAFAHARGVVHRDLKPSNIRVGGFGEVYVMDWGLAKYAGRPDSRDIEASPEPLERRAPLLTMDGDVLGTPCTMSPEQAEGRVREIGPRSDVYSVGAMLYEILAGRMPFLHEDETPSSATVLERVRSGSPEPLRQICPKAPPELVSICEKAMARDPSGRYPDMREMASDLRAYLELRVVRAHARGAWPALVMWVKRNRWLSVAIASVVVISTAAAIYATVLRHRNERRLRLVADSRSPRILVDRFAGIYPDDPERIPAMKSWLAEVDDVLSRREAYRSELAELRNAALPWNPRDLKETEAEKERQGRLDSSQRLLEFYLGQEQKILTKGGLSDEGLTLTEVRGKLSSIRESVETNTPKAEPQRLSWRFADPELQFRHDTIASMLPELEPLIGSAATEKVEAIEGLASRMRRRLAFAASVEAATLEDVRELWDRAIASIRNKKECPAYEGLVIRPQIGLVPIRRDPSTGLWEFLHVESGAAPSIRPEGGYVVEESTGIVLVLLPGGRDIVMGAQRSSPDLPNFDPAAAPEEWSTQNERPEAARLPSLDPFFISKYEMTQAQWRRITGGNCGLFTPRSAPEHVRSEIHPIENVTWEEALQVAQEVGLTLPSEAQWEFAARAGTHTPWWTGIERATLEGAANIADRRRSLETRSSGAESKDWPELDDGYALHAPVGSFRANPFGLFDVCGNVSEWCHDIGATTYDLIVETGKIGTQERIKLDEGIRVHRGGSFATRAALCRSSARAFNGPKKSQDSIGLRPSRELEP